MREVGDGVVLGIESRRVAGHERDVDERDERVYRGREGEGTEEGREGDVGEGRGRFGVGIRGRGWRGVVEERGSMRERKLEVGRVKTEKSDRQVASREENGATRLSLEVGGDRRLT